MSARWRGVPRWRLAWFEVRHGAPVALDVLRRRLGLGRALRALASFAWRSLLTDPFRPLRRDAPPCAGERFTRRQLRPVLLLDAALQRGLGLSPADALDVLGELVAQTGARFVATLVRHPTAPEWERMDAAARQAFGEEMLAGFGNAEAVLRPEAQADFAFDVQRCHFVELTARLGRPELAGLFCAADSVFYADPAVPVALDRPTTLATGGPRCAFRLRFEREA